MSKYTPWFPGAVKPVRVGVYQQWCGYGRVIGYQHWNGNRWSAWAPTIKEALADAGCLVGANTGDWRGLAEKPA